MVLRNSTQVTRGQACAVEVEGLDRHAAQEVQRLGGAQVTRKRLAERRHAVLEAILVHEQPPLQEARSRIQLVGIAHGGERIQHGLPVA